MKWLLLALPFLLPVSAFAAEPIVVRNFDQPAWDKTHGIELTEDLRIGGKDQDDIVFGTNVYLAVDSKGQIITADFTQSLVRRFGPDGTLIGPIGRTGEGPGEYRFPSVMAVDSKDNLYLAASHRFTVFDAGGAYVSDFRDETDAYPISLDVLSDGGVLVAEYDRPTKTVIQKYTAKKKTLHFCEAAKLEGQKADPMGAWGIGGYIDVGSDGMIYFTQMSPYEIRKFSPAGDLIMQVFRENDFVTAPVVTRKGSSTAYLPWSGSIAIFVLPDGRFLNVVGLVRESKFAATVLDLFDTEGHLLLSQRLDRFYFPQLLDNSGNLYSFDRDDLAVVRSRMTIH